MTEGGGGSKEEGDYLSALSAYSFRRYSNIRASAAASALACYDYQACECPDYRETAAAFFVSQQIAPSNFAAISAAAFAIIGIGVSWGGQMLRRSLRDEQHAEHVDVEVPMEALLGDGFERRKFVDSRVVHQNVEPTIGLDRIVD